MKWAFQNLSHRRSIELILDFNPFVLNDVLTIQIPAKLVLKMMYLSTHCMSSSRKRETEETVKNESFHFVEDDNYAVFAFEKVYLAHASQTFSTVWLVWDWGSMILGWRFFGLMRDSIQRVNL